jgi:pimeloyl-ACP methyl ester carboxylesterase
MNDPMKPIPLPPQVAAQEGPASLPDGAKLWYWDTGGTGPTIVLLHAASGSALSWGYQQPVFAAAGYRVIAYSRRGYYGSDPAPKHASPTSAEDLHQLVAFLGLDRFHAVGTAAGVSFTLDYAISHPNRLCSMVLACGVGGATDADYREMQAGVKPPNYDAYPVSFREVGPSYRAANHPGTQLWEETHRRSMTGEWNIEYSNQITWAKLAALNIPTLLIAGDADLSAPPSMVRKYAEHLAQSEFIAVPEAGHSVFWERPDIFNRLTLDFIANHR